MAPQDIDLSRAAWQKSTYSNNGGACVEVASNLPGIIAVRDSKDPGGPVLIFPLHEWQSFAKGMKAAQSSLVP